MERKTSEEGASEMKSGSGGSSYNIPAKRRWKGLIILVLGLGLLSMLVHLVFLFGLPKGFHSYSGYMQEHLSSDSDVRGYNHHVDSESRNKSKEDKSKYIDALVKRLRPTSPKDFGSSFVKEANNVTHAPPLPPERAKIHMESNLSRSGDKENVYDNISGNREGKTVCETKYGSYCLWHREHREQMKDNTVKKMKDQLFVARAYYPSIAKLPALDKLSHELRQNIQEFERVLSETTTDKDLPPLIEKKLEKMEATIIQAKSCNVDCNNVDKKFRQLVDLTEDEADFHMKQSAFLFHLAIQTLPKSLHCLSMRLTVEYFRSPPPDTDTSLTDKFSNPDFHHYVIFSTNMLASSAVINSTVMNANETSTLVFHVLTDGQNYFAMKLWYFRNIYKEATVQVLNIDDLKWSNNYNIFGSRLLLPQEFRVSFRRIDDIGRAWYQTDYLSVFSHAHYILPDVFKTLNKVVILDDDVIVQRDLSALWSLNMGGKVNGAVLLCSVKLFHLTDNLGGNSLSEDSCAWMSGLNIIDLHRWREINLTKTYERFIHEHLGKRQELSDAVILRATLLAYSGLVYGLDGSWMLSGLGYNYGLSRETIEKAAALHFNGNMKPWLELGIPKYKGLWRNFLNPENGVLNDCNVNQ